MNEPFRYSLRVRYQETDQQGIVYHSRYLEYLDIAMTEFFRDLGWDFLDLVAHGLDPSLVETTVKFHAPAKFDEELDINVAPIKVGNSSFTLAYEVTRKGEIEALLVARTAYVNVDPKNWQATALPSDIKALLHERLRPDDA